MSNQFSEDDYRKAAENAPRTGTGHFATGGTVRDYRTPLPVVELGPGELVGSPDDRLDNQKHELQRPFRTALLAGLGLAVAAAVVMVVAFVLVLILFEVGSSNKSPAPSNTGGFSTVCDDGSTPTTQDGSPICNDGTVPAGWLP